jgi:hypothetical protein
VNDGNPWERNTTEAEELEDRFTEALADGHLSPRELADLRLRLRQNVQRHDENQHVISLGITYLRGGEASRTNYFSQTNRKQRQNARAGFRTLEGGIPDEDTAA